MTHGCKAINHTVSLRPTKGGSICSHSAIINFVNIVHWIVGKISDLVVGHTALTFTPGVRDPHKQELSALQKLACEQRDT